MACWACGALQPAAERVCELVGELADLDRELAALLARGLVAAKRAVNRPADVLQSVEHGAVGSGPAVADQRGDWAGGDGRCRGVVVGDAVRVGR